MSAEVIKVMCVDDNRLLAESIEGQIRRHPRFVWAGWVERTDELIARVLEQQPDIILLDIDMPGRDAFDLLCDVGAARPATRVLMFSAYVRQDYIDRAVEHGAWGYISKNEAVSDVLTAIERAAAGEFVLTGDALAEQWR